MKKIIMLIFVSLTSLSANAGLIFEDDFGTGGNTNAVTGSFGNWTVLRGNVDLWAGFSGFEGIAIDMDGTNSNAIIATTNYFSFIAGETYTLSFLLGNNTNTTSGKLDNNLFFGITPSYQAQKGDENLLAGQAGALVDFSTLNAASGYLIAHDFTPTNSFNGYIFFDSRGTADSGGAIVDNVRLSSVDNASLAATVPEPSTLALFGLTLIGLASRRTNKR